jgi:hypothetical protein
MMNIAASTLDIAMEHGISEEVPNLFSFWRLHISQVNYFVNTAWTNQCRVQLFRVIGSHDKNTIRAINNTIQHIEQAREIKLIIRGAIFADGLKNRVQR